MCSWPAVARNGKKGDGNVHTSKKVFGRRCDGAGYGDSFLFSLYLEKESCAGSSVKRRCLPTSKPQQRFSRSDAWGRVAGVESGSAKRAFPAVYSAYSAPELTADAARAKVLPAAGPNIDLAGGGNSQLQVNRVNRLTL